MSDIQLLYIDLFCGAGGTSTGVEHARLGGEKCARVIACVNHDRNAILSHQANHPDTLHFTEDIRTLAMAPLAQHAEQMRRQYPQARLVLWASLECTNFSKAKGGQPRDADSRTLAEHLFRYIEALRPDYIQIENVEDFMCWGDLDEHGHPVSRDKGRCYLAWVKKVCGYGYDFDWRLLNAADYGAYTSRRRFFGLFARHGLPIAWPVQTHAKATVSDGAPSENTLFPNQYKPWNAVRRVLDLDDEGSSIFAKKKPLCEKTLERIYAGLVKFVAGGKKQHEAWILKYNSMNRQHQHNAPGIDEPCPTVAVQNRLGVVKVNFLSKQFSGDPMSKNQSVEQPAGAVTTIDHHAFVTAYYTPGTNTSINEPNPTVTTKERHALVSTVGINLDAPMPDVPLEKVRLTTRRFIANEYSGGGQISSLESVCPAILTMPKQKVVSADQFLMNPQYQSDGGSIDKPCFTLIARMDKMPPYLITTEQGDLGIAIYDTDSPMTRKVKEFMAMYGIIDIKMRMLNIQELKRIQGFPDTYVLIGTQAEQKKFLGNAVEVNMSRVLCEALCEKLSKCETKP
ncbi:MAG: DNA cytosine methyltransferase [Prevotella sp.]|nr:DNA cytosine methyltransferase [Prevotella sp.]